MKTHFLLYLSVTDGHTITANTGIKKVSVMLKLFWCNKTAASISYNVQSVLKLHSYYIHKLIDYIFVAKFVGPHVSRAVFHRWLVSCPHFYMRSYSYGKAPSPAVRIHQRGVHWTDFREMLYRWLLFMKTCWQKFIFFFEKGVKNTGLFLYEHLSTIRCCWWHQIATKPFFL
jgi:hypothetical protein